MLGNLDTAHARSATARARDGLGLQTRSRSGKALQTEPKDNSMVLLTDISPAAPERCHSEGRHCVTLHPDAHCSHLRPHHRRLTPSSNRVRI